MGSSYGRHTEIQRLQMWGSTVLPWVWWALDWLLAVLSPRVLVRRNIGDFRTDCWHSNSFLHPRSPEMKINFLLLWPSWAMDVQCQSHKSMGLSAGCVRRFVHRTKVTGEQKSTMQAHVSLRPSYRLNFRTSNSVFDSVLWLGKTPSR